MESPLSRILEEPILLVASIFLVGLVAYTVVKRLLKLALVFALGWAVLIGYFAWTGEEPPPAMKKLQDEAKRKIERGVEIGREKAEAATEKIGDTVREATEEAIDGATKKLGGGR